MSKKDTSDSSSKIIIYPDFEKLKVELEKLRIELSLLVLEKDDLLYHECKNIEMAYMLAIGGIEYKAYQMECTILRLKRKAEIIQAHKNRQEKVILSKIEKVLDAEFTEYQAKLDEQVNKMNAALERSHEQLLTDDESNEMKKLYRAIVKSLHPDLHPDLSEAMYQLFQRAVEAYEFADINGLRIISEMVTDPVVPDITSDGMVHMLKEKDRLTKLLLCVNDRIASIKSEYPYTMKIVLESPDKIEEQKVELEEHIKQLKEVLAASTAKIEEMLR